MHRPPALDFATGLALAAVLAYLTALSLHWEEVGVTPEAYVGVLRDHEVLEWSVNAAKWKTILARDPQCASACTFILGSSRVAEVDRNVLGARTDVCNLSVGGLDLRTLLQISRALAPAMPGERQTVYLGLDHFLFWLEQRPALWRAAPRPLVDALHLFAPLAHLTPGELLRAASTWGSHHQSRRFEDRPVLFYPDGHIFTPQYYAAKFQGQVERVESRSLALAAQVTFPESVRLEPRNVRAFRETLGVLRAKGYRLHLFWNPLVPAYFARVRHRATDLFMATIDSVERVVREESVEGYAGADGGLDASRFGCTDADYIDAIHVDIDCLSRYFRAVLGNHADMGEVSLSRLVFAMRQREYNAQLTMGRPKAGANR